MRFIPSTSLKSAVAKVELEFDGVYDIAGETVLEVDDEGKPTKTRKYYKKVVPGENPDATIPDDDGDESVNPGGNGGDDLVG